MAAGERDSLARMTSCNVAGAVAIVAAAAISLLAGCDQTPAIDATKKASNQVSSAATSMPKPPEPPKLPENPPPPT